MKKLVESLDRAARWLDADDDPSAPSYDPVHLAGALIGTLTAVGAAYWLLWTLLVYEGGLFSKLGPALSVLLTSKTAADYGYRGSPYAMGVFEGWQGNLAALLVLIVVVTALHRAYVDAARGRK